MTPIANAIYADGLSLAAGAASATTPLPNDSSGAGLARYYRITALGSAYVRIGTATVVATASSTLVQPGDSVILSRSGATHIAVIQGAAATTVNVVPLDDL